MPLKINLKELFKESNLIIATLTIFNLTPGKWIYNTTQNMLYVC
jgi:hypothetical protein